MSMPASMHIAHLFLVGRTLGRAWRWCWRWRQAAMRKPLLRHSACCRAASGQGQGRDAILGVGVVVVERLKSTATPVLGLAASSEEYRRPPANGRGASREVQMASLHHRGAGQGPNVPRGACLFLRWLGPLAADNEPGAVAQTLGSSGPGPDPPPPAPGSRPGIGPLMPRPAGIRPSSTTPMEPLRKRGRDGVGVLATRVDGATIECTTPSCHFHPRQSS